MQSDTTVPEGSPHSWDTHKLLSRGQPLLAGFLLHTTELMHMERGGFPGGVGVVVYSGDEQRQIHRGQQWGLFGTLSGWRKGELGPRGSMGRLEAVLLSSL